MKFSLLLVFVASTLFSQNGYIVTINKDTIDIKDVRFDREFKHVICQNGRKIIKYPARDILALRQDTNIYETGQLRLKKTRRKHYYFLKRSVTGKLNLYEIKVTDGNYTFRGWAKRKTSTIFYYKKAGESRKEFSKSWREKTGDCKLIEDKLNAREKTLPTKPLEIVRFYNFSC